MATVKEEWGMACPKCGKDDDLSVSIVITTIAHLTVDGTDCEDGGDHEWDGNSWCGCGCGHDGTVADFEDCATIATAPKVANQWRK